jgi:hypothetical protein
MTGWRWKSSADRGADAAATSVGHLRANYPGFWFVLEGQEEFLFEGEPLIRAQQGDVVFKPVGRWHRATAAGAGTQPGWRSTRGREFALVSGGGGK